MQAHLQRLYGDDWESQLAATTGGNRSPTRVPGGGGTMRRTSSTFAISALGGGLPPSISPPKPLSRELGSSDDSVHAAGTTVAGMANMGVMDGQQIDPNKLLGHLECVRLLVQGMERRLIERAAELDDKERKASSSSGSRV
jgi:hypothetical protein